MLAYAIFAVTFVVSLIIAVLYLYPVCIFILLSAALAFLLCTGWCVLLVGGGGGGGGGILLPAHPASFAHNFVYGMQRFYFSESHDTIVNSTADLSLKIKYGTLLF